MNFIRSLAAVAAALSLAAMCLPAAAQVTVLKLNHTDTPSGARHLASELFARKVEDYTRGKYRVLVFHSGQLGNDPQSIKAVSEGKLDFTTSATGSFASLVPELNLTALPYLVDTYEQGWQLYDESAWMRRQFDKLPAKGIRHIATWEAGFRSFTTKSPLAAPADAAGKKMRVFPNEMIKWIMEALGYEPVVLPVTEVYAAIQQGRVDGQENPIDTIRSLRFYEVAPNIVLTQHVYSPIPFVMSEQLWARLSIADRDHFRKAAREAAAYSRKLVKEADAINLQAMAAAGAKVTRPDLVAFRKAVSPVYARAETAYGNEVRLLLDEARPQQKVATR